MKLPRVICAKYSDLYDNICLEIIRNPAFGLDFFILFLNENENFSYYVYLNEKEKYFLSHISKREYPPKRECPPIASPG